MVNELAKIAYKKWSKEESQTLKETFMDGRELGIAHNQLIQLVADELDRSFTEVQRKLVRMYDKDEELQELRQERWSKDKILNKLEDLYRNNKPLNKNNLPSKLMHILLKVVAPKAPEHRTFFPSIDHALAEAVHSCGYQRNEDGSEGKSIDSLEDALQYVRRSHKKRHSWSLEEIKDILSSLHGANFPLTLSFLANHRDLYKDTLGINRKLESFKDVIKKFVDDQSIESYGDLVCTIAPEYIAYYNPQKTRLKISTEELRVKKYLDANSIKYIMPKLSDKLPTSLATHANFVPDFVILDDEDIPVAIVEVFGSIADRQNAGVDEIYSKKTKAKRDFYNNIKDVHFIEIFNNKTQCDLGDSILGEKFNPYMKINNGIEDLVIIEPKELVATIQRHGGAILRQGSQYGFYTKAGLDFQFDSLFELPELSSKNPKLKEVIKYLQQKQKNEIRVPKTDSHKDYNPRSTYNDSNLWIPKESE